MKITEEKTSAIIPYSQNNRIHNETQIDRIATSIKEFGFNQPIVIDENNVVLVGHGRLDAAKKLGLHVVPVLKKTGLSETQKRAYRILDNKLQNDSTWDFDSVALELEFLEQNNFELEPWGLDDLKSLFPEEGVPEEFTEDVTDGLTEEVVFKIRLPREDSDTFEEALDGLLKQFPKTKKEKS